MKIFSGTKKEEHASLETEQTSQREEKKSTVHSATSSDVIIAPVVTEKAHTMASVNKYVFRVRGHAKKDAIRCAVRDLYSVTVEKVHLISLPAKQRRIGKSIGWRKGYRKAIVTLKKGQAIEIFKGV